MRLENNDIMRVSDLIYILNITERIPQLFLIITLSPMFIYHLEVFINKSKKMPIYSFRVTHLFKVK